MPMTPDYLSREHVVPRFAGVFILIFHVVLNERAKQEIFKTGWKNVGRVRAFVAGQPYHSSSYGGSKVNK